MPSPIAHAAMGYLIYRASRSRLPEEASRYVGPLPQLLVASVGLSLLPDVDSVIGVRAGDLGRFHNNLMNSMVTGLAVAVGVGAVAWLMKRSGFRRWFAIALVSYELHVLMDYFTLGRGVMLAWPFLHDRFESPVKLFYGLHWSQGLTSPKHLLTLANELGFVGAIGFVVLVFRRKKLVAALDKTAARVGESEA